MRSFDRRQFTLMRAPTGTTSMSVEGYAVNIEDNGYALVANAMVPTMKSHGFEVADQSQNPETAGMARQELVEEAVRHSRRDIESMSDDDLREAINRARKKLEDKDSAGKERAVDAAQVSIEKHKNDVRGMVFQSKVTWLRNQGVTITRGMTKEAVEAIVEETLTKLYGAAEAAAATEL